MALKRVCAKGGCFKPTSSRFCDDHKRPPRAPKARSKTKRLYGRRWRKASRVFLEDHPLCARCWPDIVEATVVDHIIPHKGDMELFWDGSNWQTLCTRCHNQKTANEDGGFGRTPKAKEPEMNV